MTPTKRTKPIYRTISTRRMQLRHWEIGKFIVERFTGRRSIGLFFSSEMSGGEGNDDSVSTDEDLVVTSTRATGIMTRTGQQRRVRRHRNLSPDEDDEDDDDDDDEAEEDRREKEKAASAGSPDAASSTQ